MEQAKQSNTAGVGTRFDSEEKVSRREIESLLTQKEALELFEVRDGDLINKVARGRRARPGCLAGSPNGDGYLRVRVKGAQFRVHRIIWLMTYGRWPEGQIDHVNGVRDDNRIENMREVTAQGNQRNQHIRIDNTSGVTGVALEGGLWTARIKVSGKKIRLGRFSTLGEATAARKAAELVLGFHPNHGATDEARKFGRRRSAVPQVKRVA